MQGHVRKRGKRWCVVVDLPRGVDRKRRSKWYSGYASKKEADLARVQILGEIAAGQYVEPSRMTVAAYMEKWLAHVEAAQGVKAQTAQNYAGSVRREILPALGSLPLGKVTPLLIQELYDRRLSEGLAPSTILLLHAVLNRALGQAVQWDLLAKNPCARVDPPKARPAERPVLDLAQMQRLLKALEETRLHLPTLIAVATGLRAGEILGLRWEAIDLEGGSLLVDRAAVRLNGETILDRPKSKKSRRRLPLPCLVVEALRRHREAQEGVKLLLGTLWQGTGHVLTQDFGQPVTPITFSGAFGRWMAKHHERLGVPKIRFHDLRHTHATLLLGEGVHTQTVTARLGHTHSRITEEVYLHVPQPLQEEASRRIDAALRRPEA